MTDYTFADDEDTEPVTNDDQSEDANTESSEPSEGSDSDSSDSLRRDYPDYPAQDEGPAEPAAPLYPSDDGGGDDGEGSGDSGGGGSGGGSAPAAGAAAAPTDAKADEDRKKKWREKRKAEHDKRKAEHEKKKQEHKDAVAKSIERNQKKSQRPAPAPPPPKPAVRRVPPPKPVPTPPPVIMRAPAVQAVAQTKSFTQRAATTPIFRAPAVATAPLRATTSRTTRKFGYEDIAWELGNMAGIPQELQAAFQGDDSAFGVLTIDDMVAIEKYIKNTMALTPEATKVKDEYIAWFDGLYWFDKTSQANFDKARNYRNQFNLANAQTAEEKATVQAVITQGLSKEQNQGDTDRRSSTGMYPNHPDPLIPLQWEIAGVVIAAITLLVGVHAAAGAAVRR